MKKLVVNKRIAALVLLLVICTFSAAADDFVLDEKIGMVLLQMLSSPWVKRIACIALIVECVEEQKRRQAFHNVPPKRLFCCVRFAATQPALRTP
ncbi:MAG: hypothetical protein LBK73_08085 [Treponema sp.]|jgi:hypothetical protein|nr:hypothetical protein [Treponema sp.]